MMKIDNDSFYRTIMDAMPLMIFVVDGDVRVRDLNEAAARVFGPDKAVILNRRGGEVLHCLHAQDVPEGCGRGPHCPNCLIRNSVTESLKGQEARRRRTEVELLLGGTEKELELLITAVPLPGRSEPLALLIVEDITQFSSLQNIIPICVRCKKIRDDRQYWRSVESYFNNYIGVDFSHGLCPGCLKEFYPEFHGKEKEV